jgi:hypothetical protein
MKNLAVRSPSVRTGKGGAGSLSSARSALACDRRGRVSALESLPAFLFSPPRPALRSSLPQGPRPLWKGSLNNVNTQCSCVRQRPASLAGGPTDPLANVWRWRRVTPWIGYHVDASQGTLGRFPLLSSLVSSGDEVCDFHSPRPLSLSHHLNTINRPVLTCSTPSLSHNYQPPSTAY